MPDLERSVRAEVERMARDVDVGNDVFVEVVRRLGRRRRMRTVHAGLLLAFVVLSTGLGAFALQRVFGNPTTAAAGLTNARVAAATVRSDLQIAATAHRSSADSNAATVRVTALVLDHGSWRPAGSALIGARGSWGWDAVTGAGGVCELVISERSGGVLVELRLARALRSADGTGRQCSVLFDARIQRGEVISR
jgi:hypothetical protein